jgi:hypothetical protein
MYNTTVIIQGIIQSIQRIGNLPGIKITSISKI